MENAKKCKQQSTTIPNFFFYIFLRTHHIAILSSNYSLQIFTFVPQTPRVLTTAWPTSDS